MYTRRNCCGCIPSEDDKEFPVLAKIFTGLANVDYYKAFCSKNELIKECLETPDGSLSTDKKLYRRGRDLMVKREVEESICFRRVATILIDEYDLLSDFETVENTVQASQTIPKMSCDDLAAIAEQLNQ